MVARFDHKQKENLDKLVSAAGCKVESYWTSIFGSALNGKDILDILAAPGTECVTRCDG